jgi:hypothetical protein
MKKVILMLLLTIGVGVCAQAQAPKKASAKLPKQLAEKLNLTADQQTKIDAILKTKAARLDSISAATDQSNPKALHKSKKGINTTAAVQIDKLLNDDQKKIYNDFKDQQKEKMKAKKADALPPSAGNTPPGE